MNFGILLGAGNGTRFGGDKIFSQIYGVPIFQFSVEKFQDCAEIEKFLVVANKKNFLKFKKFFAKKTERFSKFAGIFLGGKSRFESSFIGFSAAKISKKDIAIFHNLCNPGVEISEILATISTAKKIGAAGVGRKIFGTIRKKNYGTIEREKMWEMQTPQAIEAKIFMKGCQKINKKIPTDDLEIAEKMGILPEILPTNLQNFKITTQQDLVFFKKILSKNFRVGIGQDSHRFSDVGKLILGGIKISTAKKLIGNSDGDAVLHSIWNAISSAIGGNSISTVADEICFKGEKNSANFFPPLLEKLKNMKGEIENIAISIEALKPKLEKLLPKMQKRIGQILEISAQKIGICVTSGENLTSAGKGEGVFCNSICQLSFLV